MQEKDRSVEMVARAQTGDPLAFAELYVELFDPVHRWLRSVLKDREDAADAAQQVFLRAFEGLPRLSEHTVFRSWVFSIARNLAFDRLGAASRSTFAVDPAVMDVQSERPEANSESRDHRAIEWMIEHLAPAQRQVLTLRFVLDMATADIALVLGMSADAVRHVQQRALRTLARDPRLTPMALAPVRC